MAATRTIKCDSCGYPYETKRPNTKRCRVCQLIQRLTWLGNRTATCSIPPGHHFVALDGHDKECGKHDMIPRKGDAEGDCKLCGRFSKKLLHESIAVCRECATKPENRDEFLHKLKLKQAWQQTHADAAQV